MNEEFLNCEVLEKRRTVFPQMHDEVSSWVQSHSDLVSAFVLLLSNSQISVAPYTGGTGNIYMVRPSDSAESNDACWKREIAAVANEISQARPNLWTKSTVCPEREIKVHVTAAPNPVYTTKTQLGKSNNQLSKSNQLNFTKKSQQKEDKAEEKKEEKREEEKREKFQVPLDSLDALNDDDVDMEEEEEEPAPSVNAAQSIVSVESSMPPKKRRKQAVVSGGLNFVPEEVHVVAAPTAPALVTGEDGKLYREVVVKKKTVTTEYAMSESGEMIVKDVEKMVEEIVREPYRAPAISVKSSGASSKSSQGSLAGFFRPKK